jgi:capsular polysaccharide biosynthesis protein
LVLSHPSWPDALRALFDRDGARVETAKAGRAEIRFCGFGRRRIQRLLGWFDCLADADPPLIELDEVLFIPRMRCLYDAEGRRIEPTKVTYVEPDAPALANPKIAQVEQDTMPAAIEPPAKLQCIEQPVLFLGEAHDHYGHLLADTLGRMWALDRAPAELKVLFAPDPKLRLNPPLVRLMLARLGLDEARILRPQRPTLFQRVLCPVAALQQSRVYRAFERPHLRIARALPGAPAPDRPVYLSRRGLGRSHRRPKCEEMLEARLQREGFAIVRPERLDLAAQAAIFNGDQPIVGAYGSALHTVLFRTRPEGARLGVLFPQRFALPPRFAMIDAVKGSRAAYINCLRPAGEGPAQDDWRIDVEAAMAHLDGAGFFARRGASA